MNEPKPQPRDIMSEKTLVERLQAGEACAEMGQRCRVMNAESGCICAAAATALTQAQTELAGSRRIIDELKEELRKAQERCAWTASAIDAALKEKM